jgi:3D-(3,5/4)-trihydroxycyclohexane-1,2-dione acylhydrolase (decyclizing)
MIETNAKSRPGGLKVLYRMNKTRRLTTAGALVEFLKAQYVARDGVEHRLIHGIFGIFGHGNVAGLGQALEEYGGEDLPFHQPKNEQAMVHSAAAFAKARRGLGTLACTTSVGPGATNMITGAAAATINRLPVLLLPGDCFASRIPAPVLQQLESPNSMDLSVNDCFRPVSKYWDRIQRPEQLLKALPEAMRVLADPAERGAVTIALPEDVQSEAYRYPASFFEKRAYRMTRARCSDEDVAAAARLLRNARRPLIVAGGGVHSSEAEAALEAFADASGIPVCMTQAGVGSLLDAHPSCLGAVGTTGNLAANRIAREADVIVALGTRLSDFTTASKTQFHPNARFIGVNVDARDAHKHGALPLVGDARAVLSDLLAALRGYRVAREYERRLASARSAWEKAYRSIARVSGRLSQAAAIRVLNEELGADATVVHAAGGIPGDIHKLWKARAALDYHSEYGYSCMGYEIAGALGVKMASPEREVYALLGDGSYLMLNHEIATSIQEKKKITIVLIDNSGYHCIENLQRSCGGNSFGNRFKDFTVDYMANAKSLGASVFQARTAKEFKAALKKARSEKKTSFIYVPLSAVKALPGYSWWEVPPAEVSGLPSVRKARADYDGAKKRQNFHY